MNFSSLLNACGAPIWTAENGCCNSNAPDPFLDKGSINSPPSGSAGSFSSTLGDLMRGHPDQRSRVDPITAAEKGDVQAIADILEASSLDERMAVEALKAVYMLAPDRDDPLHQVRRQQLGDAGACEALPVVMKTHMANADVQEQGCIALWNLARDPVNASRMAEAGACTVLPCCMCAHRTSLIVQVNALIATINLARDRRSVSQLTASGACAASMSAMQSHQKVRDVQYWGCRCITNLACDNPTAQRAFGESGGCETVTRAMRMFAEDKDLQEMGLYAMLHLAKDVDNRDRLQLTGRELITAILDKSEPSEKLAQAAHDLRQILK